MPLSKKYGVFFEGFDADSTFEFYEAVRKRLPTARFPQENRHLNELLEFADEVDVFAFDAIGVLDAGGHAHRIAERFSIAVEFHGKPFPSIFKLVMDQLETGQDKNLNSTFGTV